MAETGNTESAGWLPAARHVLQHGFAIVDGGGQHRAPTEQDWQELERPEWQTPNINGVILDHFTASMLVQVHDALSPQNAAKYASMPLSRAVEVGWRLAGGSGK